MTPEAQRIAIAGACGITVCGSCHNMIDETCCCCGSPIDHYPDGHSPIPMGCRCGYAKQPQPQWLGVPDYLNNLNAMAVAESTLTDAQESLMRTWLDEICERPGKFPGGVDSRLTIRVWRSTAAQRAEAFLKTLNLWTD